MSISEILGTAQQSLDLLGGGASLIHQLKQLVASAEDGKISAAEAAELTLKLQEQLIEARTAQLTIMSELLELKQSMIDMDRKAELTAKYGLQQTAGGALVLQLKAEHEGSEVPHQICVDCAEDGKKAILQPHGTGVMCERCDTFFDTKARSAGPGITVASGWEI